MSASELNELRVSTRAESGTAACRRLRANNMVPAVIYGHGKEALAVSVPEHELELLLAHGARLLDINLKGKAEKVLIKDVQYNHLGTKIVHADLIRVSLDETIRLTVPIELRGAVDAASHGGGVVEQHIAELEVECLASNIPESIQLQVGKLALGDTIRVRDIPVDPGVTVLTDSEAMVVTVKLVVGEAAVEEAEVEETAKGDEPEVIGRPPEEEAEQEDK